MRTKRTLLALLGSGLLALAAAACSDEAKPGADGAGSGGSGGATASGSGGSGGTAGSGGSAGSAGSGGAGASGGSAGAAGSGGSSGAAGSGGSGGGFEPSEPELLSETGLYSDIANDVIADGVLSFEPAYQLWSDGATKRRWVSLPAGAQIDTSDMDYWEYPVGTKLWKEFTRDGTRIETRLLQKNGEGDWYMMAFVWNEEQTEATAAPDGLMNAMGTMHDVPTKVDCQTCHDNMVDNVLGFSAVQLSRTAANAGDVTITELIADGKLTNPPSSAIALPGTSVDQAALGYLHANCGLCHNDGGGSGIYDMVKMVLWAKTTDLSSPQTMPAYTTTVDATLESSSSPVDSPTVRITEGFPDESAVFFRMDSAPEADHHMPPLGTEVKDTDGGVEAVRLWIESLDD